MDVRIYFDGPVNLFPGEKSGLRPLNLNTIDWQSGRSLTFEFVPNELPKRLQRTYIAVAHPVVLHNRAIGAIVVAKQKTSVNHSVTQLVKRAGDSRGALGLIVSAARRVVPVAADRAAGARALGRGGRVVAAGTTTSRCRAGRPARSGTSPTASGDMAGRLAEAEAQERNFLMSVSHELRTPLTAIRGHVSAYAKGSSRSPELAAHSLEIVEAEARRLEALVGDILDLAKLDAHRFTVMREEVDMEAARRPGRTRRSPSRRARVRSTTASTSARAR
jgi:signal transduction histidine kinase